MYSNQYKTDLRLLALSAIREAKSSIHLVMFGLTEPSILQELVRKSYEDHVFCKIFYDPNASNKLRTPCDFLSLHPVFSKGLMHQKILVIDEKMVFLGSANMTKSSLQMHDNMILGMVSPKIAQFLCARTPEKSGHIKAMVGAQEVEVYLLPDPRGVAIQAIKQKIAQAHRSLKIAMFTFTHPALVQAILDAKKKGVQVSVAIEKNARFGSSYKAIEQLQNAGVTIITNQQHALMHHKFLLIDDEALILGSANWTKAAFYQNHDSFVILHHLTSEQKKAIKAIWSRLLQ